MIATHRVRNSKGKTVGFIANNTFINYYNIAKGGYNLDNLRVQKNGVIRVSGRIKEISIEQYNHRLYTELVSHNMFSRDIQSEFYYWKNNSSDCVLYVRGPRQVGKTTEILKFAYKEYDNIIYVNLANDEYDFTGSVQGIVAYNIEKYCEKANLPCYDNSNKTVLVIDEIQRSHVVFNAIRNLKKQLKCHVIITGSYLGVTLNAKYFQPAGDVWVLQMLPMSFREFARALKKENALNSISISGDSQKSEYSVLDKMYNIYKRVGGYPYIVKQWVEFHDLSKCYEAIGNLLDIFRGESSSYFSDNKEPEIFRYVYETVILDMCREKRGSGNNIIGSITNLIKKRNSKLLVSRDEVSSAVRWLEYSGIVEEICMYNVESKCSIPARRLYFWDCGILSYLGEQYSIGKDTLNGLLTETFAFSELNRLYYVPYSRKKVHGDRVSFSVYQDYELDFIITDVDDKVYGIEVKTSRGNTKSLSVYINKKFINKGIVANASCGGRGKHFDTIPIYTVGCKFPYRL